MGNLKDNHPELFGIVDKEFLETLDDTKEHISNMLKVPINELNNSSVPHLAKQTKDTKGKVDVKQRRSK